MSRNLNYRKLIVAGFVASIAIFSFWHLSTAGSNYDFLTTSDSGFFYGIAREINQKGGYIENYNLSHAPDGKVLKKSHQFQPLMLVAFYKGANAINPDFSLKDASMYFAPLLFAITVIGVFLSAKNIKGDIAGCASALLFSTLAGSIYWAKLGAFDREISMIFFAVWVFYFFTKMIKSDGKSILKYSIMGGLTFGIFMSTWPGAPFILPILLLGVGIIVLNKAISGLGISIVGFLLIFVGTNFSGFNIAILLGTILLLSGLVKLGLNWGKTGKIEKEIWNSIKSNKGIIAGTSCFLAVTSIIAVTLGSSGPSLMINLFTKKFVSMVGISLGGGGISFPTIATEQAGVTSSRYLTYMITKLYGSKILTGISIAFVSVVLVKFLFDTNRKMAYSVSWLIILLPAPILQARFIRLLWPIWPIIAGVGVGMIFNYAKQLLLDNKFSTYKFTKILKNPLVLSLVFLLTVAPYIHNVRAHTSDSSPSPHGGSLPGERYHDLSSCSEWINNNTPQDSILGIRWSYGYFLTGATERGTITDGGQIMWNTNTWKDNSPIKPPDYITYESEGQGYIIGKNASLRDNKVNGRRPDISRFNKTYPEKARQILDMYNDYNVKMDYFVFDYQWEANGIYSNITETKRADNSFAYGNSIMYQFDNTEVMYNRGRAYSTSDNFKPLPVLVLMLKRTGTNTRVININMFSDYKPENHMNKALVLNYKARGFKKRGFIVTQKGAPVATLGEFRVPLISKVKDNYNLPDFISLEYNAPENNFGVASIDYSYV